MPNLRVGVGYDPLVGAAEAAAAKRERRTLVSFMFAVAVIGVIGCGRDADVLVQAC